MTTIIRVRLRIISLGSDQKGHTRVEHSYSTTALDTFMVSSCSSEASLLDTYLRLPDFIVLSRSPLSTTYLRLATTMSELSPQFFNIGITSSSPEQRTEAEERWVSYQPYLLSKGYQLRPRYREDWVPSWKTNGKNSHDCEDKGDTLVSHATCPLTNARTRLTVFNRRSKYWMQRVCPIIRKLSSNFVSHPRTTEMAKKK